MISSDEGEEEDGGIFDQGSVISNEEDFKSCNSGSPTITSKSGFSFFRRSSSSSNSKEYDAATEEIARKDRIAIILQHEKKLAISLRAAQAYRISREMLTRQENDIHEAFSEVDYLRAELAELIPNKVIPTYRKGILAKYVTANRKELASRQHYATLVLSAAIGDSTAFKSNEEWKNRVENDLLVKIESKIIKLDKHINKNVVLRKKHEYDYNRAKAILKADYEALQAAWPGVDYSSLLIENDRGRSDSRPSIGREARNKRTSTEYCPSDIYK